MVAVLIAVFVTLSTLGAGGEYAAEKLYYRAIKTNNKIMANPDVIPPGQALYVENNLKKILEKYPKTKVATTANISLIEFYLFHKRYDDALLQADSIIKTYDKNPTILSTAYFLKGRAYEKQDKWQKALKEYEIVRDEYTKTQLGMQMPLYIAKYYSDKGKDTAAGEAYSNAASFYERLERENSGKVLGYISYTLLLQTYINSGNYDKAGKILGDTIDKYRSGMTLNQLLPQVEIIYVKELQQPEKAIEIYKSIQQNYKDERLNKILQKRIDALSDKK